MRIVLLFLLALFVHRAAARGYIFALATDYQWNMIEVFVKSARHARIGDVWLGVREHSIPQLLSDARDEYPAVRFIPVQPPEDIALYLWRFQLYTNWSYIASASDWILTCDARDTVFQSNPFAEPLVRTLAPVNLFEEDRRMRIGTCPHNSGWIRGCWGEKGLTPLADKHIICAGNTMGRPAEMRHFWRGLLETATTSPLCATGGANDQGSLNYHYYTNVAPHRDPSARTVKLWRRGTGPVNTVGYIVPDSALPLNSGGFVINDNSQLAPVVHQYDRFSILSSKYHSFGWSTAAAATSPECAGKPPQSDGYIWAPYVSGGLLQQIHSCDRSLVAPVHTADGGTKYTTQRRSRPVQIVDIAPLFDEMALLEIRLYELRDVVDWFIVIEQNETHTGLAKEVIFHQHVDRLTRLLGMHVMRKVIYYNCPYSADLRVEKVVLGSSPQQALHWRRENYMRNRCALQKIEELRPKLSPDALMMMSDMDEIPDAFAVASLKYCHYAPVAGSNSEARLISFGQVRYHFNFHCASSNMYHWTGTMLTTVEHGLKYGMQQIRDARQRAPVDLDLRIPHGFGGWHFSNSPFGDAQKLVNKYRAFTESQTVGHLNSSDMAAMLEYWQYTMENGGDTRSNTQCHENELRHLPRLVHDMPHKYATLLSKDQKHRLID